VLEKRGYTLNHKSHVMHASMPACLPACLPAWLRTVGFFVGLLDGCGTTDDGFVLGTSKLGDDEDNDEGTGEVEVDVHAPPSELLILHVD
jgi:hypothetical protein